jgi:hypothetical protein
MFQATSCLSSGESIVSIQHLVCVTLKTSEWSKITKGVSQNALLIDGDKILVKVLYKTFMANMFGCIIECRFKVWWAIYIL